MKYLNLGCGRRYHAAWVNLDFYRAGPGVAACDLSRGIPYPADFFDVVYHSHLLEHFGRTEGERFMRECARVLRPTGVLRVVVPVLEENARTYLALLEKVRAGGHEVDQANYDWLVLELYDQAVRRKPGGGMAEYLASGKVLNAAYVEGRGGSELRAILDGAARERARSPWDRYPRRVWRRLRRWLRHPFDLLAAPLPGHAFRCLQAGRFLESGELHQWMYDSYSLGRLMARCGLSGIRRRGATESYVQNWPQFNLDTEADGSVYKPASLFMEAVKPG